MIVPHAQRDRIWRGFVLLNFDELKRFLILFQAIVLHPVEGAGRAFRSSMTILRHAGSPTAGWGGIRPSWATMKWNGSYFRVKSITNLSREVEASYYYNYPPPHTSAARPLRLTTVDATKCSLKMMAARCT